MNRSRESVWMSKTTRNIYMLFLMRRLYHLKRSMAHYLLSKLLLQKALCFAMGTFPSARIISFVQNVQFLSKSGFVQEKH